MSKPMYTGLLTLSLLIGACTPGSNDGYDQGALETQSTRHFMVFVDNGLEAAHRGLMELEQETVEAATETDTMVSKAVAELRWQYEELSEEAESLVQSEDTSLADERLNLRDRLLDLSITVEKTRLELIDESEEYRDTVKRRLTELDQRMYQLTVDVEEAGLSTEFDEIIARLDSLREEAATQVTKLENVTSDEFAELRDDATDALATFSARLIEAETEYETAATVEGTVSNRDAMSTGRVAVVPIDQSQ